MVHGNVEESLLSRDASFDDHLPAEAHLAPILLFFGASLRHICLPRHFNWFSLACCLVSICSSYLLRYFMVLLRYITFDIGFVYIHVVPCSGNYIDESWARSTFTKSE